MVIVIVLHKVYTNRLGDQAISKDPFDFFSSTFAVKVCFSK